MRANCSSHLKLYLLLIDDFCVFDDFAPFQCLGLNKSLERFGRTTGRVGPTHRELLLNVGHSEHLIDRYAELCVMQRGTTFPKRSGNRTAECTGGDTGVIG